jgi:hypothetical protein
VFKRGGIRFIVLDCYVTDAQTSWVRDLIVKPDDSSATIILQHDCSVSRLAKYFEGLDGRHNVKAVLVGHDHRFRKRQKHGVFFIEGAGVFWGRLKESDAMVLRVYREHVQLDRYVLPAGDAGQGIRSPETVWTCPGRFTAYERPAPVEDPGPVRPLAQMGGGVPGDAVHIDAPVDTVVDQPADRAPARHP